MRALAGVLFEVRAFDPNHNAVGDLEMPIDIKRAVILRNLVRLRHIWVEVVLSRKGARLNRAVESKPDAHCELDSMAVEHRKGAWKSKGNRVNVCIRVIAEPVR